MSVPKIFVKRLWTEYKPDPKDGSKVVGIDWAEYSPIGSADRLAVIERVSRLRDRLQPLVDNGNPAIAMAHARWEAIKPYYEAWKAGQEMPLTGTPLAAFNAITPEQADVLRVHGVRSIEELSDLTDTHATRIPLPRMRDLIEQAKRFVASADTMRAAAAMAEQHAAMETLKAENAAKDETIAKLAARVDQLAELVAAKAASIAPESGGGLLPEDGKRKASRAA